MLPVHGSPVRSPWGPRHRQAGALTCPGSSIFLQYQQERREQGISWDPSKRREEEREVITVERLRLLSRGSLVISRRCRSQAHEQAAGVGRPPAELARGNATLVLLI
ncbi:hypothetical protein CDL15_Pgr003215 [Punica granatum]|nr:hypothetical protein CDL15_Pgr003215 [Punica granatum]